MPVPRQVPTTQAAAVPLVAGALLAELGAEALGVVPAVPLVLVHPATASPRPAIRTSLEIPI
jgi:hypothetical protein